MTTLGERIWRLERDASGDEALAIAKSAALVRLDEDELERVMNLAEKPHQNAGSSVRAVHR